ncbi:MULTISPECIES: magnesium/cobalt transporter CorA [unclassified Streptomyces]|uniref:magnesium/cobalt transporter CorA n=1 Tax=unclassified Streptomyces TaxID=2593676 RepID=UPI000B86ADBE|nr:MULTISPECIES: magnesium/cobalt transporter CorA [unclassified Streptomyces]MYS24640.1 magnesium/cobalt transporter CorA [Streptomyces sp. SID4948]
MTHRPRIIHHKDGTRRTIGRQWRRAGSKWHTLGKDGDLPEQRRCTADVVVDCAVYEDGCRVASIPPQEALAEARKRPGGFAWIGLHEPEQEHLAEIAEEFGLHPLAVEDAVQAHQRPKLERYGETLFLVLKTIVFVEHEKLTATSEVVDTGEVMIFLGADFVVVVRHGSAPGLSRVRRALENRPDLLVHGPAAVLHAITDQVVDDYLDVADAVELDVEEMESDVFSANHGDDAERIYQLKRELIEFKRAVHPMARPLQRLSEETDALIGAEIGRYFRDVADHLSQVRERLASYGELVDGLLSANLSQLAVQQNVDMRRISAAAAILAIPTMIAGFYGMNFTHMPELHWTFGYPLMVGVTAVLSGLCYRAFRRIGWL